MKKLRQIIREQLQNVANYPKGSWVKYNSPVPPNKMKVGKVMGIGRDGNNKQMLRIAGKWVPLENIIEPYDKAGEYNRRLEKRLAKVGITERWEDVGKNPKGDLYFNTQNNSYYLNTYQQGSSQLTKIDLEDIDWGKYEPTPLGKIHFQKHHQPKKRSRFWE